MFDFLLFSKDTRVLILLRRTTRQDFIETFVIKLE